MKQDLHKLDQYQATLMMEEPPMPPMEVIFQPSMAMVQAVKIQPRTVSRKAQIWTTRIFISSVRDLNLGGVLSESHLLRFFQRELGYILE